jgi:hypothetical protein
VAAPQDAERTQAGDAFVGVRRKQAHVAVDGVGGVDERAQAVTREAMPPCCASSRKAPRALE